MAGSKEGGLKAAATNKRKYGRSFYVNIGAVGGKAGSTGGFASNKKGADGLTGRERAAIVGRLGGELSKRKHRFIGFDANGEPQYQRTI